MNKSLSTRLMYSFMALIMVIVVGVTAGISYLIADYFFKTNEQELAEKGNEMAATVEYFMGFSNSMEMLNRYVFAVDRLVGARIWLFDDKFELLAASNINTDYKQDGTRPGIKDLTMLEGSVAEIAREIKSGKLDTKVITILKDVYSGKSVQSQIYHPYYKEQVMLVGVPYGKPGQARGAILLAQPLSGFDSFLRDIYIYTSIVAILALILSMFMVRSLARTIIKPLVSMKDSAMAIAAGDYTRKVALNALGNDLSAFVAKTERAEKIRRDFVANVSHELRTPLTIIRGYNEAISDGTVTDKDMIQRYRLLINEETMRLERMIRELLDISRMQAADELAPAKMQPLPLGAIVRNVAEKLMVNAVERNVKLLVHVDEKIQIMGQGDQMVQLVLIIGDNALKYTPENGTVTFVTELQQDGSVKMTISDQGINHIRATCPVQGLALPLQGKLSVCTEPKCRYSANLAKARVLKLHSLKIKLFRNDWRGKLETCIIANGSSGEK